MGRGLTLVSNKSDAPMGHSTTPAKKKLFLVALRNHGTVKKASEIVGVSPQTPYDWRRKDKAFKAKWESMLEDMMDDVELKAHTSHALNDPNFAKWILAMRRPEKYNKNVEGTVSGDIKIEIVERSNDE
jgi:transposase-like protein